MRSSFKFITAATTGFHPIYRGRVAWTLLFQLALVPMLSVNQAAAIPLRVLVETQGSIQQGDKLFKNFRAASNPPIGAASPLSAGDIDVQGITVSGENGLKFSGPFTASFEVGGSPAFGAYHFGYDVSVLDPSFSASDFHSTLTLTTSGDVRGAGVDGNIGNEVASCSFFDCGPGGFRKFTFTDFSPLAAANNPAIVTDSIEFPFLTKFVSVDVDLNTAVGGLLASAAASETIPFIVQTFSQQVPEPSTLLVLGGGLVMFGASKLCRKFKPLRSNNTVGNV